MLGDRLTGLGVGIYQRVKGQVTGCQLGLVNISDRVNGVQIGLFNYIEENPGWLKVLPIVNWSFN